ncbi:hypothetical protein QL285_081707 [Trifolium repens]|nr:hypothetical protein QL285_081707 [Trifolium repens]
MKRHPKTKALEGASIFHNFLTPRAVDTQATRNNMIRLKKVPSYQTSIATCRARPAVIINRTTALQGLLPAKFHYRTVVAATAKSTCGYYHSPATSRKLEPL